MYQVCDVLRCVCVCVRASVRVNVVCVCACVLRGGVCRSDKSAPLNITHDTRHTNHNYRFVQISSLTHAIDLQAKVRKAPLCVSGMMFGVAVGCCR